MPKMIFVNLPVADVAAATAFYTALGFTQNMMFSNEQASAIEVSETISVMLLDKAFYATFTSKPIADTRATSAVLLALSLDSRDEVDSLTRAAVAAGGQSLHDAEDMGYMYSRAFEDLDGHSWGPFFMDMAAAAQAMTPEGAPAVA
jgi:predicted lactoylglutathione lyase